MSILSDTVRGVGRLLFPVRCPVCGGKMPPGSRVVCTRCRYAVPLTGFCYATYNPLWERLSALVPVEQASAFLYFIPGSGWRELIHRFKYDGAWRLARDMGVWYGHCLADSGLYDTVDRIVPGCKGGTYRRNNIRPACGKCNSIEGNKLQKNRRKK